jgi:hypothetical protein
VDVTIMPETGMTMRIERMRLAETKMRRMTMTAERTTMRRRQKKTRRTKMLFRWGFLAFILFSIGQLLTHIHFVM